MVSSATPEPEGDLIRRAASKVLDVGKTGGTVTFRHADFAELLEYVADVSEGDTHEVIVLDGVTECSDECSACAATYAALAVATQILGGAR